jgi:hypothetical protein
MNRSVPLALFLGGVLGVALTHTALEPLTTRLVLLLCILASLLVGTLALGALLRRLPRPVLLVLGLITLCITLRAVYFLVRFHWPHPTLGLAGLALAVVGLWRVPLPQITRGSWRLVRGAGALGLALGVQLSVLSLPTLVHGLLHHRTPLGLLGHGGLLLGPLALAWLSSSRNA